MEFIVLNYISYLCFFLALALYIFVIPLSVKNEYDKYDELEKINYISKKYYIIKPSYMMFNLDHQHKDSLYYKWISLWSEKIPRITDAPALFLKQTIASIYNKEEKKIYTEWLINRLSGRVEKNSSRKDYYKELKKAIFKIYDNLEHLDVNTEEKLNSTIENTGGRPPDFEKSDTERWFKELKENPNYQRSKGKPYIKKIDQELISRHKKETGSAPSKGTMKDHRRELGFTQK
jgi:hypothetical protein